MIMNICHQPTTESTTNFTMLLHLIFARTSHGSNSQEEPGLITMP